MNLQPSLWGELRCRNVIRVAAAYGVSAWLLLQVADIMLDNFGAPLWVFKSFAGLLALGFPVALFLSWAYELTPEGVKRSHEITPEESITPVTGRRIDRLILAGLLAVIALLVVERVWFAQRTGATATSGGQGEVAAEAHAAMAFVRDRYYQDEAGAAEYFERTLELNPNHATAYYLYSDTLHDLGRLDRMLEVSRTAAELDPLSAFLQSRYASRLVSVGRPVEGRTLLESILRDFPDNDHAHEELGSLAMGEGRFAAALEHFRIVHASRPGDPYSAARIATMAAWLGEIGIAQAWIAAARARGEDNRWELVGREHLAIGSEDWSELDRVGDRLGGSNGAALRAVAAARSGDLHEARRHLLDALRLSGYDPATPPKLQDTRKLIELAHVEQSLGFPEWRDRLAAAQPVIERLLAYGALSMDVNDVHYNIQLARIHGLLGERDAALAQIRQAVASGYREPWLNREPYFSAWREDADFQSAFTGIAALIEAEREKLPGRELMP